MLTCRELVELVTDYLEGALAPEGQHEMHAHLVNCADCLRYLGQIQLTSRLLSQLPYPQLTDEMNAALAGSFRAAAGARP